MNTAQMSQEQQKQQSRAKTSALMGNQQTEMDQQAFSEGRNKTSLKISCYFFIALVTDIRANNSPCDNQSTSATPNRIVDREINNDKNNHSLRNAETWNWDGWHTDSLRGGEG